MLAVSLFWQCLCLRVSMIFLQRSLCCTVTKLSWTYMWSLATQQTQVSDIRLLTGSPNQTFRPLDSSAGSLQTELSSPMLGRIEYWQNRKSSFTVQGKPTLCYTVRLHIPIIVLACPHETPLWLHGKCHHVINEPMFVPNPSSFKLWFVVTGTKKKI